MLGYETGSIRIMIKRNCAWFRYRDLGFNAFIEKVFKN